MPLSNRRWSVLFFLPAAVFMVLFFVYPMFLLFRDSLFDNETSSQFVGMAHYAQALDSSSFQKALLNTVVYVVSAVSVELVLGMAIALLLSTGFRGSGMVRTLLLSPLMISPLVCGLIWKFMLSDQFGILNVLLYKIGLAATPQSILWLSDSKYALLSCILADVWLTTPFMMLVLLAGIQGIPSSLYEAAAIDGANRLKRLMHITLPGVKPVMTVAVVIRIIDAARSFDIIWVMTQGGPSNASTLVSTLVYKSLARFNQPGYASAMAILFMIILLVTCSFFMKHFWRSNKTTAR